MPAQSGLGFSGIVAINIPDDGATGEVLTKITPDNYDYDWAPGGGGGGAPTNAEYVVLTADATLTDERVLTAGSGISIVDGGAGGPITVSIDPAVVDLQFAYDNDTTVPQITVNGTPDPVTIDASVAGDVFVVRDVANADLFNVATTEITIGATTEADTNQTRNFGRQQATGLFNRIRGRLGIFVGASTAAGAVDTPPQGTFSYGGNPTGIMAGNMKEEPGTTVTFRHGGSGGGTPFKPVATLANAFSYGGDATVSNDGGEIIC